MTIKFLKAFSGDSILISFLDNEIPKNILIDGGIGHTYVTKSNITGELYETVKKIREDKQFIDLLVITHFDDDHIGGILTWLNKDKDAAGLIKKVWFNSGKEIAKAFKAEENDDLNFELAKEADEFHTSPDQGIRFEKYLQTNNLWNGEIIQQGLVFDLFGLRFKILSPNKDKLEKLLKLYKKQKNYSTSGGDNDYQTSLEDFINEEDRPCFQFKEDTRVANGSSIAFILENRNKRFVFLGDAHPSVVVEGLKKFSFDEDNPLYAELMKVSHHGSTYNTSTEILEIVKTDNYIISSDATKHGLPNKRTIARIIKNNPNAIIYFNYDLKDTIFSVKDWKDYTNFKSKMQTQFQWTKTT